MTATLLKFSFNTIEQDITNHPAWLGNVSGLKAEKLLRNRTKSYIYVIRAGENEGDYYVTYTLPDGSIQHRPFVITVTPMGWHCENGGAYGPFAEASIDDVLHLIMHCERSECVPLINSEVK